MIATSQIQLIGAVLPVPPGRSEDSKAKGRIEIERGKGRRTVGTSAANGLIENAGRLSSSVIVVANVSEKSILVPCWFSWPLLQSPSSYVVSIGSLASVFCNEAPEALMALALQVVSSHLLGARDIEQALSVQAVLGKLLLPHAASEAETLKRPNCLRLFVLDGCSINLPLGPLSSRLRAHSPGSKFLALLPPDRSDESELLLLFNWGIDGLVTLHKKWKTELPKAAVALLRGRPWVPPEVLLAFVKQMKALLDRQLQSGQSLTAREGQVLQLLFRRLTNKEIAYELNISERTAKFHVSNVVSKLGLPNRRNLVVSVSGN